MSNYFIIANLKSNYIIHNTIFLKLNILLKNKTLILIKKLIEGRCEIFKN